MKSLTFTFLLIVLSSNALFAQQHVSASKAINQVWHGKATRLHAQLDSNQFQSMGNALVSVKPRHVRRDFWDASTQNWKAVEYYDFTYDVKHAKPLDRLYFNSDSVLVSKDEYTYNEAGYLKSEKHYQRFDSDLKLIESNDYSYDAKGNLTDDINEYDSDNNGILDAKDYYRFVHQYTSGNVQPSSTASLFSENGVDYVEEGRLQYVIASGVITELTIQEKSGLSFQNLFRFTAIEARHLNFNDLYFDDIFEIDEAPEYILKMTAQEWSGSIWENSSRITTVFNQNDQQVDRSFDVYEQNAWRPEYKYVIKRDDKGNNLSFKLERYNGSNLELEEETKNKLSYSTSNELLIDEIDSYDFDLQQFEKDERYVYSKHVSVGLESPKYLEGINVQIYPNPISSASKLTLQVHLAKEERMAIALYDSKGVLIQTIQEYNLFNAGTNQIVLDNLELPQGMYFIQIQGTNFYTQKRLVIMH